MAEEKMKQLALERMEFLKKKGLMPEVVKDYKKGKIWFSRRTPYGGILYWCNDAGGFPRECKAKLNELQADGNIVYHITNEFLESGDELYSFLLFNPEYEEKDNDEFFKYGITYAYVMNITEPMFSDFGTVIVKPSTGGLIRID